VQVLFRGHTEFTEVPDQPTAPINPGPATLRTDATTHATSDHAIAGADSAPVTLTSAASSLPMLSATHADATVAPVQLVGSAVTDIQAPAELSGIGGGDVARDGDSLASLALNGSDYAEHGWFIVPSTTNEYGDPGGSGQAFAAADDFSFDVAGGSFSSDWFWA